MAEEWLTTAGPAMKPLPSAPVHLSQESGRHSTRQGDSTMCSGQNGHRHLGALHILYQQQPTDLDRRFIEIRPVAHGRGRVQRSDLRARSAARRRLADRDNGYAVPLHSRPIIRSNQQPERGIHHTDEKRGLHNLPSCKSLPVPGLQWARTDANRKLSLLSRSRMYTVLSTTQKACCGLFRPGTRYCAKQCRHRPPTAR